VLEEGPTGKRCPALAVERRFCCTTEPVKWGCDTGVLAPVPNRSRASQGQKQVIGLLSVDIRMAVLINKSRLGVAWYIILLVLLLAAGISAQVSPTASDLPSDQKVLAFVTESIDWYRHRAAEEQVATDPAELFFIESDRPVALHIIQLSLEFARADASLAAMFQASNEGTSAGTATNSSAELSHFVDLENKVDLATQQVQQQVDAIKKKLIPAQGTERQTLKTALDVTQRRLEVLQAELASLQELVDFVQVTAVRQSDLTSSIEGLARTISEATTPPMKSRMQGPEAGSSPKPRDTGILGLSSDVTRIERKLRILDDEIHRTEQLRQSSSDVRKPLVDYANKSLTITAASDPQAGDLNVLRQQKTQLDGVIAAAKALAPAIVALDKQNVLLTAYISRLRSWRTAVLSDKEKTWRDLILRLVGVATAIGALLLVGAVARRLSDRHVHQTGRRHVFRVIERVAPLVVIVVITAGSFTSDLTSLATFFGLLTAGVAIALQNVIVSGLGYFMLVGKRGIKIGDRVQISGITGDVSDIGWLQFQIQEFGKETQRPTGNVVTFPNSLVLSSGGVGRSERGR